MRRAFVLATLLALAACRSSGVVVDGYLEAPSSGVVAELTTYPPGSVRLQNLGAPELVVELEDEAGEVERKARLGRGESRTWKLAGVRRWLRLVGPPEGTTVAYELWGREGAAFEWPAHGAR